MPVISIGSINIPSDDFRIMKAESLKILADRQPLDTSEASVPDADPSTWTNKQLIQYHLVNGPHLTQLMRPALVAEDSAVVSAESDSSTKGATFDAARNDHNDATATLKTARATARDTANATVTGFALT